MMQGIYQLFVMEFDGPAPGQYISVIGEKESVIDLINMRYFLLSLLGIVLEFKSIYCGSVTGELR